MKTLSQIDIDIDAARDWDAMDAADLWNHIQRCLKSIRLKDQTAEKSAEIAGEED